MNRPTTLARLTLATLLLSALLITAAPAAARTFGEFETLTMIFEQNETDGDAEVVIFAKADEGMSHFLIFDPRGDRRVDLESRGRRDIGLGQFRLESAEPSIAAVKRAFPPGSYTFLARTVSGRLLKGVLSFTHALLPAPAFTPADEEGLDPDDVVVTWTPVPGAAAYIVEIEQDDLGNNLTATVGPDVSSLAVPPGFLKPGTEYEVGVATVTAAGNVAVAEGSFTTED